MKALEAKREAALAAQQARLKTNEEKKLAGIAASKADAERAAAVRERVASKAAAATPQ